MSIDNYCVGTGLCVPTLIPGFCFIHGYCFADGTENPHGDTCQVRTLLDIYHKTQQICETSISTTSWSACERGDDEHVTDFELMPMECLDCGFSLDHIVV